MPPRPISVRLSNTFRALRWPNFRLFVFGQAVSLIGTWMQQLAMAWLVYRLTGSALLLGTIAFCTQAPSLFFGPLAGMAADRYDRRKLLIFFQGLMGLQALALATLTMTGVVAIWHLIVLSFVLGICTAFEVPARQSFVIRMVDDRADVTNAIALNSMVFNTARLIGPAIAGVTVARLGEGLVFLVNGLSYLAVIIALNKMRLDPFVRVPMTGGAGAHFAQGYRYAFGTKQIRAILVLLALLGLTGMPYAILLPVIVDRVFGGGAEMLGHMMGIAGFGALIVAVWLAGRRSAEGLNRAVPMAGIAFAVSMAAIAASTSLALTYAAMFVIGLCGILMVAGSNTILQSLVPEHLLGRMMSYFSMSVLGIAPFGGLLAGWVADKLGAPKTLFLGGACCLVAVIALAPAYWKIEIPAVEAGETVPAPRPAH